MEERKLSFVGWAIILLLIFLVGKTNAGYKMIYYSLVLILVLLFVGQYKAIEKAMYKN